MTPISTDREPETGQDSGPASLRPFRRSLVATVAILAILCAGFVALGYFQGPKLSSGQIDTSTAVVKPGQQLRLFANQGLAPIKKSQVTVTPATDFTVASSGAMISLQFSQRLHYATDYHVRVRDVSSAFDAASHSFDYRFTTGKATLYYLDRADPAKGGDDEIIRTGVIGSASTVVYSAPHIQQFTAFDTALAVVTLNDDGTSTLSLASLASPVVETIQLPGTGTVTELGGAVDAARLGFVFTSSGPVSGREYENTLMTIDLTGTHLPQPVLGLDGNPLSVLAWDFLGGTGTLVVQAFDQSVSVIDPTAPKKAVPLGVFAGFDGSSPDGSTIVVADADGRIAYTLATGKEKRLGVTAIGGEKTFGGQVELLATGTARVQQVAVVSADFLSYTSSLVYADGTRTRVLYTTPDGKGSIDDFQVSPNGQYVAINVVPDYANSVSDDYRVNPQSTSITTIFVDVATGAIVRSVAGFDEDW